MAYWPAPSPACDQLRGVSLFSIRTAQHRSGDLPRGNYRCRDGPPMTGTVGKRKMLDAETYCVVCCVTDRVDATCSVSYCVFLQHANLNFVSMSSIGTNEPFRILRVRAGLHRPDPWQRQHHMIDGAETTRNLLLASVILTIGVAGASAADLGAARRRPPRWRGYDGSGSTSAAERVPPCSRRASRTMIILRQPKLHSGPQIQLHRRRVRGYNWQPQSLSSSVSMPNWSWDGEGSVTIFLLGSQELEQRLQLLP